MLGLALLISAPIKPVWHLGVIGFDFERILRGWGYSIKVILKFEDINDRLDGFEGLILAPTNAFLARFAQGVSHERVRGKVVCIASDEAERSALEATGQHFDAVIADERKLEEIKPHLAAVKTILLPGLVYSKKLGGFEQTQWFYNVQSKQKSERST